MRICVKNMNKLNFIKLCVNLSNFNHNLINIYKNLIKNLQKFNKKLIYRKKIGQQNLLQYYFPKDHRGWYGNKDLVAKYMHDNNIQVAPENVSERQSNVNYFNFKEYKEFAENEFKEYKKQCDDEANQDIKYDAKYAKSKYKFFRKYPMLFCKLCANASAYRAVCQREVGEYANGILHGHTVKYHPTVKKYALLSFIHQIFIKFFCIFYKILINLLETTND